MRSPDREVIPQVLNPGDPCAQDESLLEPGNIDNFRRYGGRCEPSRWEAEERRFHAARLAILAGRLDWDAPDRLEAARALGIDGPRHHDARPGRVAAVPVPDEVLCDVVEDAVPELLMLLERVTGEAGMPARPPIGAVAVLGFIHCGIEGTRPIQGWMDEEVDRELVQSVRVVDDAPMSAWLNPRHAEPVGPLGPALLPVVPALRPPDADPVWAALPACFLGRAYRVQPTGWAFSCVVPLPVPVDGARTAVARVLERRMLLELEDLRRTERRATFEDVLRHRPEVVCRAVMETLRDTSAR